MTWTAICCVWRGRHSCSAVSALSHQIYDKNHQRNFRKSKKLWACRIAQKELGSQNGSRCFAGRATGARFTLAAAWDLKHLENANGWTWRCHVWLQSTGALLSANHQPAVCTPHYACPVNLCNGCWKSILEEVSIYLCLGFLVDNETWFTFSQAVLLLLLYLQQERHFCSSGEWPTGKQTFTDFLFLFFFRLFSSSSLLPSYPSIIRCNYILISHLNISKYHVWTSNCLDATTKRISTWNAVPNLLQSAALTICSWWPSRPSKRCLSRLSATKASTSLVSILQTWMKQSYHHWIICIWHIGSRVFPETVKVWQSGAAFVPSKKWCGEFTCIGRCGHLKVQKWRAANMNWIATDFRHTLALNSITQAS